MEFFKDFKFCVFGGEGATKKGRDRHSREIEYLFIVTKK